MRISPLADRTACSQRKKNDKLPNITGTLSNIITSLAIFKYLLLNSYIIIKQLLDITHNEPLNNHKYKLKLYFPTATHKTT